jgi:uncharacterized membrane protein
MLLAVIGLGLGWSTKATCAQSFKTDSGQVALDWRDYTQYRNHCYSDIIPLYGLERLQDGDLPYKTGWSDGDQTRYMEYPVLTGMLQYEAMRVTKIYLNAAEDLSNPDPPEVVTYFIVMAIVLGLSWLVAVRCTIPLVARRRDVVLMALSPLVAVHVFTNFDAFAVGLAAAGMLAWVRGKPILSGVLFGLGAAAKLYPLFILGPLLILCLRTGRMRPWWRSFGAAVVAWAVVNLPIAVLYPQGWWEFFRLNSTRQADPDSIYNAISVFTGWKGFDGQLYGGETPSKLNLISLGLFVVICLAVAVVGLTAPTRPRVASLAFLIVAAFLLTNKVWSPQYSLWLVPLAVLALPHWLPLLAWMSVDAYVWYPRMGWYLNLGDLSDHHNPIRGNSQEQFLHVVLLRDALVLLICALVVRTIYWPDVDPVRRAGFDDPAGGPLDGADDRSWPWLRPSDRRSRRSRRAGAGPGPDPARPAMTPTSFTAAGVTR